MLKFSAVRRLFASVFAGAFFFLTFVSTKTNNNPKFKIMSVSLYKGNEAAKIAESFESEDVQRQIWYAYISNVTAYNVQYRENAQIDFKGWEANEEKFENIHEAIEALGGLLYNAYTNAGNSFAPEGVLQALAALGTKHERSASYKIWHFDRFMQSEG